MLIVEELHVLLIVAASLIVYLNVQINQSLAHRRMFASHQPEIQIYNGTFGS